MSDVSRDSATEATLTLAYDGEDITANGTLSVTVRDSGHTGSGDLVTNSVPITATALALTAPDNQGYPINRAIPALTLLEAIGATGTATYTLTGPTGESLATAVPGLAFTPADRILSGTPTATGTTTLTYTVTDSATPPATASATFDVTIAPTLAITSPSVPEGDSGPATLTYAVTLTGATDQTVTVRYAVDASSTATVLDDYPVLPDGTLTFTSGTTTQTIEVEVTGDTDVEENETIVVLLLGATNATIVTALGTGTIIDDDGLPTISIAAMPSSVPEGTAATFTLTADPAPATELTIMVSVTDSGDFIAGPAPTMVTIAADATTATLTVGTIDDTNDEFNGVITATVEEDPDTDADYIVAASPDNRATVAVGDDDDDAVDPLVDPVITIAAVTSSVPEGTAATFTLTATPAPATELTVMVSVTDSGNFIAGPAPTMVTIPASETTATLTVPTEDDDVNEAIGMITATVDNGVGYTFVAPATADVTITDDDPVPTLEISSSSSPPSVDEGDNETATSLFYTVTLTGATEQAVTVEYETGGTATEGQTEGPGVDYIVNRELGMPSGSLVFMPGTTSRTIEVVVVDDTIDEDDETVIITLSGPTNARITTATGTGRIIDDDTLTISIVAVTSPVTEGTAATFRLTADPAPATELTVMVSVTDSGDFIAGPAPTMVTIAAGETTATLTVETDDDRVDEANGMITATVTNGIGYTVGDPPATASVTITDNDAAPTLAIDSPSVDEGATRLTYTVTLSEASERTVTVDYAVDEGNSTATVGDDYTDLPAGTLTFAPSTTIQTIEVAVTDDTIDEENETVIIILSNPANADITTTADGTGTGTITDNDAAPTLAIDSPSVDEGATSLTYTVTLSGASGRTVTVDYAVDEGNSTATVGDDYTDLPAGTLTFAPSTTIQTIEVAVTDDTIDEENETVIIILSNPANADITTTADGTGIGTITDNDAAPTLAIDSPSVDEGATSLTYTVTLSEASGRTVTVDYAVDEGNSTATVGDDYTDLPAGTLTFAPSTTIQTIEVAVTDDTIDEENETVIIILSNPANADITTTADGTGTGTITDNDAAPTLAIDSPSVDEGATSLTYTVTLSGASGRTVTVDYAVDEGNSTATVGDDYTDLPAGTLTFAPSTTIQTIEVAVTDDTIDEENETVIIILSNYHHHRRPHRHWHDYR